MQLKKRRSSYRKNQLEPLFPFEIPNHSRNSKQHNAPHNIIAIPPVYFREILEIGSINPDNESDRNKNNGNNGEHPHNVIQSGAHRRMINVQLVVKNFAVII